MFPFPPFLQLVASLVVDNVVNAGRGVDDDEIDRARNVGVRTHDLTLGVARDQAVGNEVRARELDDDLRLGLPPPWRKEGPVQQIYRLVTGSKSDSL